MACRQSREVEAPALRSLPQDQSCLSREIYRCEIFREKFRIRCRRDHGGIVGRKPTRWEENRQAFFGCLNLEGFPQLLICCYATRDEQSRDFVLAGGSQSLLDQVGDDCALE